MAEAREALLLIPLLLSPSKCNSCTGWAARSLTSPPFHPIQKLLLRLQPRALSGPPTDRTHRHLVQVLVGVSAILLQGRGIVVVAEKKEPDDAVDAVKHANIVEDLETTNSSQSILLLN